MANIDRPAAEAFSSSKDFARWVDRYFDVDGETRITADEWWAARNAIVHTWGVYSKNHQKPGVRALLWMADATPHVQYSPQAQPDFVLVDVLAMRDALFAGMDRFLIDAFADASRKDIVEQRVQESHHANPLQAQITSQTTVPFA